MANKYELGDKPRVTGTLTDADGAKTDPDVVLFDFLTPAGTKTTYTYETDAELVRDAEGVYHVDIDADTVGTWHYRFYSTGDGQAADEGDFFVASSAFS